MGLGNAFMGPLGLRLSNTVGQEPEIPRVPDYAAGIQMPLPGAQPRHSKGQIIAGILADALAGLAGQQGPMLAQWNRERQQEQDDVQWSRRQQAENDQWAQRQRWQQEHPDPSPMQRDIAFWQGMTQEQRAAFGEMKKAGEGDPDVFITLPNGQVYAGPRSGLAQAMMGAGQAPTAGARPPIGAIVPDPRRGGPTPRASGTFRR